MRRATELLARLEKHALDEQSIALQELEAAVAASRNERAAVERALTRELSAAWTTSGGPSGTGRFLVGQFERHGSLRIGEQALEAARVAARTALLTRLSRFKTIELADAASAARIAGERQRKCQLEIEEAGALRASHATSVTMEAD